MLCQNCQQNEVEQTFIVNWMGTVYKMHMCNACLTKMWQHNEAMGSANVIRQYTKWRPGQEKPRTSGDVPFPKEAEASLKHKRYLNALSFRLKEAARSEDYEEAARLRDQIQEIEKQEYSHGL